MDAVTLADGRQLLVYNDSAWNRWPLSVGVSQDGANWERVLVLEPWPGEYSYPAAIVGEDRLVHITYTWNLCRIKHVVLDPARV
jgi:predicted neuraminidase